MTPGMVGRWFFTSAILCMALVSTAAATTTTAHNDHTAAAATLDSAIRDRAFQTLLGRRRSGVVYPVPLPAGMSGIQASVVRVRSASLWTRGLDSAVFRVPPRTMLLPYAKRVAVVYQDLGNWSSVYYGISGYSLAAPVIGCLAFDASNITSSIDLRPDGDRISAIFPDFALRKDMKSTARCVRFGRDGAVELGDRMSSNVCSAESTGHFTIVVPSDAAPPPGGAEKGEGRRRRWWQVWVAACIGGAVGFVVVVVVGVWVVRLVRRKKREGMEVHAERGEALGAMVVGSSKMPSATMVRTRPMLENGSAP